MSVFIILSCMNGLYEIVWIWMSHLNDSWKCKINDKLDYRLNLLNFENNAYVYQSWEFKLTNGLLIKFIILTSLQLRMSEEWEQLRF
jgi:hypothetical protein